MDNVFQIISSVVAIISLVLIIIGWIIPYRQNLKINNEKNRFEIDLQKHKWKKEFVDRQIEELYGPLSELMHEHAIRRRLITEQMNLEVIFDNDRVTNLASLPSDKQKIWCHFVDEYRLPFLADSLKIIQEKYHLFYKSEIPESLHSFLEYAIGWELLSNQQRNEVPNHYDYHYRYKYPVEFDRAIEVTLGILMKQQSELLNFANNVRINNDSVPL